MGEERGRVEGLKKPPFPARGEGDLKMETI